MTLNLEVAALQESTLPLLSLPFDHPRPVLRTYRGATHRFELSPELTSGLLNLGQQEEATTNMTLLTAFSVLLFRYTEQTEVVIGTPRNHIGTEGVFGAFNNTLALQVNLAGSPNFIQLLSKVKEIVLGAFAQQELSLDPEAKVLNPERSLNYTPVFQIMFAFQNTEFSLSELQIEPLENEAATCKYDLKLVIEQSPVGLKAAFEYSLELFEAATIARMATHFTNLLNEILEKPTLPITSLSLLSQAELSQILFEKNNTATAESPSGTFHGFFEAQVARTPSATALVFEGESLTYRELNQRANHLGNQLQQAGVGPETVVALYAERSLELVVGLLAILKAGGAYLPIDPIYPSERIAYMLVDAGASLILTQPHLADKLPEQRPPIKWLERESEALSAEWDENCVSGAKPENLCYIIFTSGSTGRPKGCMIEHRSVVNLWHALTTEIYSKQPSQTLRATLNQPLVFDSSVKQLILLLSGHSLYILSEYLRRDGLGLVEYLVQNKLDVLECTPSQLEVLMEAGLRKVAGLSLKICLLGGEDITQKMWQLLRTSSSPRFYNVYGPTECTVDACVFEINETALEPRLGKPLPNVQLYILDKFQSPVPLGVAGELFIGGSGVGRGYVNHPDLTDEKFLPNPFSSEVGKRVYRTGDLVRYCADGMLQFVGRIDQQVKIRGYRIELSEIQTTILLHEGVQECVVLASEVSPGDKRLVAYLVLKKNHTFSISELRDFVKNTLPDYMVPTAFLTVESFPLTPNGKIDYKALPAPFTTNKRGEDFIAPRNELEAQLAKIWEELLEVNPIGINEDFFALGGHSLLSMRMLARIGSSMGKKLPVTIILQHPTIEQLAKAISTVTENDYSLLVPIQTKGTTRPLFLIHSANGNLVAYGELVRELGPEQVLYGIKARGVDGDQIPHSSIEEMATYYLELIKTVQPNGPYQLLGHSMGGLIVYEMARQLQHKGQEVGLVGLLDTYPPFTVQVKLRLPHIYNPFLQKQYVIMLDLFKGKKKPARTEDSVLYFDPVELWNLNEYEQQQFDYIYPKIREIDRLLSEASRKGGGNLESLKDRIVFSNSQPGEGSIEITKQVDENVPMLVQQESTKAVGFLQNLKAKAKRLIEPSKIQNYIWTKLPWLGYYMVDQKTHYLMTQFYRIDKHLPELKIIRLFEFIQIKVNGMIERAYKPQPYTGTVSFFISEEIPETNLQKDLRNWKKIIHGTTESYFVPGDHITLLEKPNVQVLAKKLLECMRESYTPSSDTNK